MHQSDIESLVRMHQVGIWRFLRALVAARLKPKT